MGDATENVHAVLSNWTSLCTFFGDQMIQSLTRNAAESALGLGSEISDGGHHRFLDVEAGRNQRISTVAVILQDLISPIVFIGMERRPGSAFWDEVR